MNPELFKKAFFIIFITFMFGCSPTIFGRNFNKIPDEELKVGKTTKDIIISYLGSPVTAVNYKIENKYNIRMYVYNYINKKELSDSKGRIPAQFQLFHFYNDTLVGYAYSNSFNSTATNFDENLLDKIIEGKTSRDKVESLLGQPNGQMTYPIISKNDSIRLVYAYIDYSSNLEPNSKILFIDIDKNNIYSGYRLGSELY